MTTIQFVYSEAVFKGLCELNDVEHIPKMPSGDSMIQVKVKQTRSEPCNRIEITGLAEINNSLDDFPGHKRQVLCGYLKTEQDEFAELVSFKLMPSKPPSPRPNKGHGHFTFAVALVRFQRRPRHMSLPLLKINEESAAPAHPAMTSSDNTMTSQSSSNAITADAIVDPRHRLSLPTWNYRRKRNKHKRRKGEQPERQ